MLSPNYILQDRYRIVRHLGQGGMGTVYEAVDQRVSCLVALKETLIGVDTQARSAFKREAALLANLRHPALPKVMDYFSEGASEFLVMEFIPGQDLSQLLELNGGPFPEQLVLRWANEILKVLEYLHSRQPPILHRDIKPSNLKVNKQGEIFLLDFGLAKGVAGQMSAIHPTMSVRGYTPAYSPLEQIYGGGTDERSDLYALGATIYHLLTTLSPVDAPARFSAVEEAKPDPLVPAHKRNPQVSPAVSTMIGRAMAMQRRLRPAKASDMRRELELARKQAQGEVRKVDESDGPEATKAAQGELPSTIQASSQIRNSVDGEARHRERSDSFSPQPSDPIRVTTIPADKFLRRGGDPRAVAKRTAGHHSAIGTVVIAVLFISIIVWGVWTKTHPITSDNNDSTVLPTASSATSRDPSSPRVPDSPERVGVPECDDFIAKYDACVSSKVPEAARAQYKSAITQWRASWKKLADNPATKGTLAAACKQAAAQQAAALKSYGCSW